MNRKRISREKISTEDLLFLEELKSHTDLLYLKHHAFGILDITGKLQLDDVDTLLRRLKIKQAVDPPQEITKKFLETTAQMLERLIRSNGFGSNRAVNGAAGLSRSLRAYIPLVSS